VIAAEIDRGVLRRGAALPPERRMCDQLGVSRVTLRKALATLSRQGLVTPSHGRGWFVTDSLLGELPNLLQSLSELAAARGLLATSRILESRTRGASLDESDMLEIGPGAPLFEMRRVRLLDSHPVAIDHARLPLSVCPHLPEVDFRSESLYTTLERHGAAPHRCDFSIQAMPADSAQAELLEIPAGSALLLAAGTTFDADGTAIELSNVLFIGERYRFRATLFRRPEARRTHTSQGGDA